MENLNSIYYLQFTVHTFCVLGSVAGAAGRTNSSNSVLPTELRTRIENKINKPERP